MTTEYWIAKYVSDPFRGETKNVGVFVRHNGQIAAKLIGVRDDGVVDNRRIRGIFSQPTVFNQWQDFWQECIAEQDLQSILNGNTTNFFVIEGGSVSDAGNDPINGICDFLFSLIVSDGGAVEAFEWNNEASYEMDLVADVSSAFEETLILADLTNQNNPHPVEKNQAVPGKSVVHTPSFSQRNGRLYVMESIDLGLSRQKPIRERAGWMAYMFSDIKESHPGTVSISIIRPEQGSGAEATRFARKVLSDTSEIVDWSDQSQRTAFLQERTRIAISFG